MPAIKKPMPGVGPAPGETIKPDPNATPTTEASAPVTGGNNPSPNPSLPGAPVPGNGKFPGNPTPVPGKTIQNPTNPNPTPTPTVPHPSVPDNFNFTPPSTTTPATPSTPATGSTPAAGSTQTPTQEALNNAATGGSALPSYVTDQNNINTIQSMYDAQLAARRAELENSYNQNVSNLQADREALRQKYLQQRNASAADYERQRRNFLEAAMTNGLNTGSSSQAQLAQNSAYQRTMGGLRASEASDIAANDRSLSNLTATYQSDINSAIANNDYQRAAALLDEYNNQYNRAIQEAQIQAQYGNFSSYAAIFGENVANQMKDIWARQNPGIAYSMGLISAAEYQQITGKKAPGTGGKRSGGGSYSGSGGNGNEPPPFTDGETPWVPATNENGTVNNPNPTTPGQSNGWQPSNGRRDGRPADEIISSDNPWAWVR